MTKRRKIVIASLWGLMVCAIAGVAALNWLAKDRDASRAAVTGPASAVAAELFYPVADFELTDQNGTPFSSTALKGKPYVASFMFTRCTGVCPKMNASMASLQRDLPGDFHLVSVTVDPANDTPATLKSYAKAFGADETRWHFLTGDLAKLMATAKGMNLGYVEWPQKHSDRILLVDAQGNARGAYHSDDPQSIKQLVLDAKKLQTTNPMTSGKTADGDKAAS